MAIDHIFPRCRGGRTVSFNAASILHAANTYVKKDLILQSINPQHMLVGISGPQLKSLFSYIEMGGENSDNKFLNRLHFAVFIMEMTPRCSGFFNFQQRSNGSLDGEGLYTILMEYHSMNIPIVGPPTATANATAPAEDADENDREGL